LRWHGEPGQPDEPKDGLFDEDIQRLLIVILREQSFDVCCIHRPALGGLQPGREATGFAPSVHGLFTFILEVDPRLGSQEEEATTAMQGRVVHTRNVAVVNADGEVRLALPASV